MNKEGFDSKSLKIVGQREKRPDALEKVTGKAIYPADFVMENMVYGYTVRSEKPSANIQVDKSAALTQPGVIHVFTAEDVPGHNHHGVLLKDQKIFADTRVTSIGEPIAFVVADSFEQAEAAGRFVKVTYEELPGVFDPVEAMKADSPKVHGDDNVLYHYKLRTGDIEKAFSECDIIIENTYKTSMVDHCFLQPESGTAYIDEDGKITVMTATQYPHYDQEEIADGLGVKKEDIRVITAAIGGAFGGREDITLQIHLALAAMVLKRPVKTMYSREDSFLAHSKRHPIFMKYRTGAKKDGTLHAMEAEIIGDSGAHASWAFSILRKAGVHATGPYCIPNVKVDSYAVYTNNPFTGAMRGFGAAQVPMANEQQMDEIARALKMDPLEFRQKNCFRKGSKTSTGQTLEESVPLAETMDAIAPDYMKFKHEIAELNMVAAGQNRFISGKKRGLGIASTFYGTGYGNGFPDVSRAHASLSAEGGVIIYTGATEVGQGSKTVLRQIAAEALSLPIDLVDLVCEDTNKTPDSGTAAASRQTYNTGNSVRLACLELRDKILEISKDMLDIPSCAGLSVECGKVHIKGLDNADLPLTEVYDYCRNSGLELRTENVFTAHTTRLDAEEGQGAPYWPYTFASHLVDVEVDINTGKVDVIRAVCAQDVGRAINPTLIEGQIEGGFAMGMGWAIYEDLGLNRGKIENNNFSKYILPTAKDMPNIKSIIIEDPESTGPYGAKGIGEPVMLAAMPAILNGIYDAVKVRITELPASPERILKGLNKL